MASPRSREESAVTIPEICHSLSSRYAEIASVARNERERPVERAIFSRRFFSAFLTRMVMVAVRGVSIMSYIVSHAVQRAMKEGSGKFHAARKSWNERTEIGIAAHADWTQDGSRISRGERGVLGFIERCLWLGLLRWRPKGRLRELR
jgi:hypothetical protein